MKITLLAALIGGAAFAGNETTLDTIDPIQSSQRVPGLVTTQAQLDSILLRMASEIYDHPGVPKLIPDMRLWSTDKETLTPGILPGGGLVNFEESVSEWIAWKWRYEINLGNTIHRMGDTGVYGLGSSSRSYVIKYHRFCADPVVDPIDPLVVEAFFLQYLAAHIPNITHKFFYLSAAVPDNLENGKTPQRPDGRQYCFHRLNSAASQETPPVVTSKIVLAVRLMQLILVLTKISEFLKSTLSCARSLSLLKPVSSRPYGLLNSLKT